MSLSSENYKNPYPGWLKALLFLLAWYMVNLLCTGLFLGFSHIIFPGPGPTAELHRLTSVIILGLLPTLGMIFLFRRVLDHKSVYSLGLAWRGYEYQGLLGFAAGAVVLLGGSLILLSKGYLKILGVHFNAGQFIFSFLMMMAVALGEELVFRGYILNNLMASFSRWTALFLSSLAFAAVHLLNPNMSIFSFMDMLVGGLFLGINYIYSRNLWFAIFLHFSWNFVQGPVLGYEVSGLAMPGIIQQQISGPDWITGGPFGFEGSVISTLLQLLITALLAVVYERKLRKKASRIMVTREANYSEK